MKTQCFHHSRYPKFETSVTFWLQSASCCCQARLLPLWHNRRTDLLGFDAGPDFDRLSLNKNRTHHDFLSARNANDHTHIFQPQKYSLLPNLHYLMCAHILCPISADRACQCTEIQLCRTNQKCIFQANSGAPSYQKRHRREHITS